MKLTHVDEETIKWKERFIDKFLRKCRKIYDRKKLNVVPSKVNKARLNGYSYFLKTRIASHLKHLQTDIKVIDDFWTPIYDVQFVYFIGYKNEIMKIGVTNSPSNRFEAISGKKKSELDLMGFIRVDKQIYPYSGFEVEKDFHNWLKDFNISGEWFDINAWQLVKSIQHENNNKGAG